MPPTVFPTETKSLSTLRDRLFVKVPRRKFLMQNLPCGKIWKNSRIVGAVTLCCIRPIDRIAVPVGDGHLLELLGLTQLWDLKNKKLAQQLREMP